MPASGGETVQVTRSGGLNPTPSSDGALIFYKIGGGIWQVPVAGGDETPVLSDHTGGQHHAIDGDGVYYLRRGVDEGSPRISVLRLKSRETFDLWTLPKEKSFEGGNSISVSPDESRVTSQLAEDTRVDLMLVEGVQ